LCLSTLHASNANGALERIVNFFPEGARGQFLMDLSSNLKAIISQRLVRAVAGGLVPAVEIMLNTPYISDLIMKGNLEKIKEAMQKGGETGMQTFDQSLLSLYRAGKISMDETVRNADSKTDVTLQIRLASGQQQDGRPKLDKIGTPQL
jgi:twitching motility protein PilU